jgi:hypothetical protein
MGNCSGGRMRWGMVVATVLGLCVAAMGGPITVSLVPSNSGIELDGPGDPLVLTIQISNPDQLVIKSWSFDMSYDPGVFQPIAGIGTVPTQGFQVGTYIPSLTNSNGLYNMFFEHNGDAPDTERMGVFNNLGTTGNATTGVLGMLALDAVGLSASTTLTITGGQLILSSGLPASGVVFDPAVVSVQLPEPGCAALALVGVIGLVRRRA